MQEMKQRAAEFDLQNTSNYLESDRKRMQERLEEEKRFSATQDSVSNIASESKDPAAYFESRKRFIDDTSR